MKSSLPLLVAAAIASPIFTAAQTSPTSEQRLQVAPESPDYWPGKYVKLPAVNNTAPAKLTYITIKKVNGEYEIEGFEGRKFVMTNFNRSLNETTTSSILTKPLARLGMGTATLQAHGVLQIVIDVFVGDEHFYLVRAEPVHE